MSDQQLIELTEGVVPAITQQGRYAIVAITKHGVEMARRLLHTFPDADLYYMSKFARGDEDTRGIQLFTGSVRLLFPALFPAYDGLILFISLGAVVRMIAPVLKDKKTDPGVVVIDDRGEHAISMLSGHLGGANELTREVAALIGAKPVITTASDVQKTIPVDLFGRRFGWTWDPESEKKLTPVSASVVNEEHVAIVQESGETDWWMHDTPMPPSLHVYPTMTEALANQPNAALLITHRLLSSEEEALTVNGVIYRPKSIVLGMGCNRGTSAEEIEQVITETLEERKFSLHSVKALCTIELKKDEQGLLDVCNKYGWEFVYYTPEQLNEMNITEPSDTVYKYTGAYGVSEPACKRYSGCQTLALTKKKSGNATISVGVLGQ
ncbi:cobalt-precorrin 5A acetaldehyde-lyase [Aneurinibacillus soli]|uniref:Cobalamin biosynthesis protein CbiG n=1 Tax=Aneurinibacillus soli TaxID=1500254 RepID=A0A0U5B3M4_9BACL|nr:cobalamin biosynthesis protein [Aneurinibacillus soli]PYE57799.1 cobalt-precorrin 5A acetaldehyde-lyase [Aneurinibacillus soli]BAU26246.1 cobalamin biosynthesis protein CbiG [Aneurinibacillus soli]